MLLLPLYAIPEAAQQRGNWTRGLFMKAKIRG
jgi:hypothetical protein